VQIGNALRRDTQSQPNPLPNWANFNRNNTLVRPYRQRRNELRLHRIVTGRTRRTLLDPLYR
jgi:hypothetical protein